MPNIHRLAGRFFCVLITLAVASNGLAASPTLCQINEGICGAKSGANKRAAALSFVQTAIGATDAVANKNIADPNKFSDGLGKVIDGVVQCLNSSVWGNKQ
jgi:hypothetical protein